MKTDTYKYIWLKNDLLYKLNELGYTHFVTKEYVQELEEGRAFYYCPINKKYGYVDVIPYDKVQDIQTNIDYINQEYIKLKQN